jgi:hypothetical protein
LRWYRNCKTLNELYISIELGYSWHWITQVWNQRTP